MAMIEEEVVETTSKTNVLKRLMKYLLPFKVPMFFVIILVLVISGLEILRPVLIGDAIDNYIEGYNKPYGVVNEQSPKAINYNGVYLSQEYDETTSKFYQLVQFQDLYYLFSDLNKSNSNALIDIDAKLVDTFKVKGDNLSISLDNHEVSGTLQSKSELEMLRSNDFIGVRDTAVLYIFILIAILVLNISQTWVLQLVGQKIIYIIRNELFNHVHSLPLKYFDTHPVGRIVTRITNDVETLHEMYSTILVRLFKNIIKIIGISIVMMSINLKMSLYAFLLLPIVVFLTFLFKKISRKMYRIARTKLSILNVFLSENISGMKLIQIFAREEKKHDEFSDRNTDLFKANLKEMYVFAIFRPLIYFISIVALVVIIGNGSISVIHNVISIGTLYIFINYIGTFYEPIQDLAEQFSTLQNALASAEKIFSVLDEENNILEIKDPIALKDPIGKIEFRHVWFAYDMEEYVLRDVSFIINPSDKVAFVGATGAGKSSILNLIGRYYDIQKGEILIDDKNIKDLKIEDLRKAIGQVQQDVFVFTGDIASNIKLLDETINDEEMIKAAKFVNADRFIEALPRTYHEEVSERGTTLSAGERQLLSFARTLAYDPKILVMDEATANIDTETESLIQEALEKLMSNRTTIMVAHRLSTIQHADNIIVMHKGKIVEMGNHQELLMHDGIYKNLYELQLKNN